MILVAGGTGLLGRQVVARLCAEGRPVRVLSRDATRARELLGPHVEVVEGDVRQATSVAAAMAGVSVAVSAVHGFLGGRGAGPSDIDVRGNATIVSAAKGVGADVVLLSVLGASATSDLELFRAKWAAEQLLRASGTGWTIVRPAAYLETWTGILRDTAKKSGRPLVFGKGLQPIAFVSATDVARAVVDAVGDKALRGRVLELAGERLTLTALAAAVQYADGRTTVARHLPRGLLRLAGLLAAPISPAFARQNRTALAMDTIDFGGSGDPAARDAVVQVGCTRTVEQVLALGRSINAQPRC